MSDLDIASAWASVLTEMNSTPAELILDHPVDGVAAAAADADHLHPGGLDAALFQLKDHGRVPLGPTQKKSWSHRFTGASTFSTAGDLRAPVPKPPLIATCRAP